MSRHSPTLLRGHQTRQNAAGECHSMGTVRLLGRNDTGESDSCGTVKILGEGEEMRLVRVIVVEL